VLAAAWAEVSTSDDAEPTNQKLIKALKAEYEPSATSSQVAVRMKYRNHLRLAETGTMEPREWYLLWKDLHNQARSLKLTEVTEGTIGSLDFLHALIPKYAPQWATIKRDQILDHGIIGGGVLPTLTQLGRLFSQKLDDVALMYPSANGAYATLGGSSTPSRGGAGGSRKKRDTPDSGDCPCRIPLEEPHPWASTGCARLRCAVMGQVYRATAHDRPLEAAEHQEVLNRLHTRKYNDLRLVLAKRFKMDTIPKKAPAIKGAAVSGGTAFPGSIVAALIDPMLLYPESSGVYSTMDFNAHPLSHSTILDNGAALHLVNNKELLVPGSFKKSVRLETVEAGTQAFPISGQGTRIIAGVVNGTRGACTEDLVLHNVAVVDGFHVNIVSEARLFVKEVWYLGLNNTLRAGSLTESTVLCNLVRHHNLTFVEYKLLNCYSTLPSMIVMTSVVPEQGKLLSWATHPRQDTEILWHLQGGHLGPQALKALVTAVRGVRLYGTPRLQCEHCAITHAKQVISRRPRERSPRPYWRIAWDLFDMPKDRGGERWLLVIKDDYSGKIHLYVIIAKSIFEIMRVMRHFVALVWTKYKLRIAKVTQDNDQATLPWRGTSEYIEWSADEGIEIEPTPPHTHQPNGSAERAGQEVITKSLKMGIGAGLPEKLWPETTQAAVWLYNMSPAHRNNLRSPNKVLHEWFTQYFKYYQPEHVRTASADLRPDWSGLYASELLSIKSNQTDVAHLI
jgi:hypothetical protein